MSYPCNPCDCPEAYYRDIESWRKAVVGLLCIIASGPPPETNRYLQEDGTFFYLTEDGSGYYIEE